MDPKDYTLELAKLRTKMAAQRTLFVCLVPLLVLFMLQPNIT